MTDHIKESELLQLIKRLDLNLDSPPKGNPENHSQETNSQDGWVKIVNNKIIVQDPHEGGTWPTIRWVEPVLLKKNNKSMIQEEGVEASDKVSWEISRKHLFSINVSNDKMEVYLHVLSKSHYAWNLKDTSETTHIIIEAVEDKEVMLESLRLTDVMMELQNINVTKNIKTSAIFQELQNPTYQPILIAFGIHPVHGEDAQLQVFFQETIENRYAEMDGVVDFRNHLRIPTAKADDVIALKIPGKPGVIGYNVFGEIIYPKEPMDITIAAKDHVMIKDDCKVIALKEGRPRVTGTVVRYFDICTSYIVTGDVNLETGNIVFSGDIIVYGNVNENMTLESLGNIYVMGNVYKATITATGGIKIKGNIIGSYLYSGYFGVIFNRLYMNTKFLSEQLLSLVHSCKMLINILESRKQSVEFPKLMTSVIETKFQELPKKVIEIINNIDTIQSTSAGELNELKEKLIVLTNPTQFHLIKSFDLLLSINNLVSDVFHMIERMQETDAHIDISQCHLTNIKSNGDTYIRKEGILQSDIYSKGNVIFFESDSVCRGGKIECGGMISAMIVGAEVGGDTYLKAGSKIMLKRMTSGKICIDRYVKDISSPIHNASFEVVNKQMVIKKFEDL
jgi:formylmethanofuran dehydrogenase subunit C